MDSRAVSARQFLLLLGCVTGCSGSFDPGALDPIQGSPAAQVEIAQAPQLIPSADPESLFVGVTVTAFDSTLHRAWRPSRIFVTSDRGYAGDLLLVPNVCLEPQSTGTFPYNFSWWTCDAAYVDAKAVLTSSEVESMDRALTASLLRSRPHLSRPGAGYFLRVPPGLPAVEEAVRRAKLFSFVGTASRVSNDPACVLSDELPPPPCPRWMLEGRLSFTFGAPVGSSVPVSHGGWIRFTYVTPSNVQQVSTFSPPG